MNHSAIGGLEHGVTTLQMAGAYSAFGNNGYYTEPHAVKEIELRDGTKINMKPKTEVAMSDYTAFMISDMLKSVVTAGYGTGTNEQMFQDFLWLVKQEQQTILMRI